MPINPTLAPLTYEDDPRDAGNTRIYPANQNVNARNMVTRNTDTGTGMRDPVYYSKWRGRQNGLGDPSYRPLMNNDNWVGENTDTGTALNDSRYTWRPGSTTPEAYNKSLMKDKLKDGPPDSPPGGGNPDNSGGDYSYYGSTTTGGTPYSGDYDLSEYLRQQAAARIESELAGLSGAYKQAMNGYDAELRNIQKSYYNQRNQSAAQDAIARRNFDERAAASGLNSGTAGQADLARSAAYTGELARLGAAEDAERNAVEMNRANAQAQYEQAMAQARANNQQQLAGDLYKELIRVQGLEREDALNAAKAAASTVRYSGGGSGSRSSGGNSGTTAEDAYKPLLTAAQARDAINAGIINDTTQRAYEYYFGERYTPAAEAAPAIDTNPAAIRAGIVNQTGYDSNGNMLVEVQGQSPYGGTQRLTLEQLANGVNSGRIYEYTDKNGKQVYVWNY